MQRGGIFRTLVGLLVVALVGCGTDEEPLATAPSGESTESEEMAPVPPLETPVWLPSEAAVVVSAPSIAGLHSLIDRALGSETVAAWTAAQFGENQGFTDGLAQWGLDAAAPCAIALDWRGADPVMRYAAAARVADPDRLRSALMKQSDWILFGAQAYSDGQILTVRGDWVVLGTAPDLMRAWARRLNNLEELPNHTEADPPLAITIHPRPLHAAWPHLTGQLASRFRWRRPIRDAVTWLAQAFDSEAPLHLGIRSTPFGLRAELAWQHAHHPNLAVVLGNPVASLPTTADTHQLWAQLAFTGAVRDVALAVLRERAAGTGDSDAAAYAERLAEEAGNMIALGMGDGAAWLALEGSSELDALCSAYLPARPDASSVLSTPLAIGRPAFYQYEEAGVLGYAVIANRADTAYATAQTLAQPLPEGQPFIRWILEWRPSIGDANSPRYPLLDRATQLSSTARVQDGADRWILDVHLTAQAKGDGPE